MEIDTAKWPHSQIELQRLRRASKVLLDMGFTSDYKMGFNVVHWAPVVKQALYDHTQPGDVQHKNFIWLCNKVATLFRKEEFPTYEDLVIIRGFSCIVHHRCDYRTIKKSWLNEKTGNTFTIGYNELIC